MSLPMFDWLTYDLAKEFQSLIVGALGFIGIIVTLIVNASLSRKQHDRTVRHERALITRALLAELRRNHEVFEDRLSSLKTIRSGSGVNIPRRTITQIYEKNFDRISYLHEDELKDVLEAYSRINASPERIMFAQLTGLSWNEIDHNDLYIKIDPRFVDSYQMLLDNALQATKTAIATLQANRL